MLKRFSVHVIHIQWILCPNLGNVVCSTFFCLYLHFLLKCLAYCYLLKFKKTTRLFIFLQFKSLHFYFRLANAFYFIFFSFPSLPSFSFEFNSYLIDSRFSLVVFFWNSYSNFLAVVSSACNRFLLSFRQKNAHCA